MRRADGDASSRATLAAELMTRQLAEVLEPFRASARELPPAERRRALAVTDQLEVFAKGGQLSRRVRRRLDAPTLVAVEQLQERIRVELSVKQQRGVTVD